MQAQTAVYQNTKIAYLAPEITAVSATFVYKEILALETQGYAVSPFSVHPKKNVATGLDELNKRVRVVYNKNLPSYVFSVFKLALKSPINSFSTIKHLINDTTKVAGFRNKVKLTYQCLAGIWLADKLSQENIQHLHIHFGHVPTQIGMYAALQSGIPFSFMVHANDLFQRALLYPQKGARASAVTTISKHNIDELVRVGVSKEKIHIVRCGINPEEFVFKRKEIINAPYRICVLARLVEKKGIDTLVQAVSILLKNGVDINLEIAGDGPDAQDLQKLITEQDIGNKVKLLGRIENNTVPDWLAQQDMFVLPARVDKNGDMDGIPVVLMEAMSQGIPVISTKISGIPELVVDQETGLIVSSDNPDELSMAIKQLIDDQDLRNALVENARNHVISEFEIGVNIKRLENVIEECLATGVE